MKITDARFAGSSTRVSQRPARALPEFAFIGRSNVGKSSLINMLTGRKGLAKTSSTPGKTQLVNHFVINDRWYLVDLPGYGYARLPQKEREELQNVISDYVLNSPDLVCLFVLIDSRHDVQKVDRDFIARLGEEGVPFALIFTKGDKMGPVALREQMERSKGILLEDWEELPPSFATSSLKGQGKEEVLDYIESILKTI